MILCTGEVIKNNDIKCVYNEGMPQHKNPFEKGKLIIQFTVNFPADNWIGLNKMRELEKYLPARTEVMVPDDAEECDLTHYEPHQNHRQRHGQVYDEDEEEGGPRVQCASQ